MGVEEWRTILPAGSPTTATTRSTSGTGPMSSASLGRSAPRTTSPGLALRSLPTRRLSGTCPWGSETRIRSRRDAVVLVDEPTEQVPPANIARADRDRDGDRGFSQRRGEAEGAMGSLPVVVLA